jgi:hypothetical protein
MASRNPIFCAGMDVRTTGRPICYNPSPGTAVAPPLGGLRKGAWIPAGDSRREFDCPAKREGGGRLKSGAPYENFILDLRLPYFSSPTLTTCIVEAALFDNGRSVIDPIESIDQFFHVFFTD